MRVVAGGVETGNQPTILRSRRCDEIGVLYFRASTACRHAADTAQVDYSGQFLTAYSCHRHPSPSLILLQVYWTDYAVFRSLCLIPIRLFVLCDAKTLHALADYMGKCQVLAGAQFLKCFFSIGSTRTVSPVVLVSMIVLCANDNVGITIKT